MLKLKYGKEMEVIWLGNQNLGIHWGFMCTIRVWACVGVKTYKVGTLW